MPVVIIEDDEGATGSNYVSTTRVAAVLGVSVDEASALLGLEPLKTAREINLSRPGSGVPVPSEEDIRPINDAARSNGASMVPTEVAGSLHRQGRWLYRDRLSLDQVPCNLVSGDGRTYNTKGDKERVWVAGSGKADESKRFCTLQLCIRGFNGDSNELYNGQPWPEVCFRGQGKILKPEERAAWNEHVHVRFQPKAW